jgi:hypothetical protein
MGNEGSGGVHLPVLSLMQLGLLLVLLLVLPVSLLLTLSPPLMSPLPVTTARPAPAGVSEAAVALADAQAVVPMVGFVDSFNISVAAALCMYEARRCRQERLG